MIEAFTPKGVESQSPGLRSYPGLARPRGVFTPRGLHRRVCNPFGVIVAPPPYPRVREYATLGFGMQPRWGKYSKGRSSWSGEELLCERVRTDGALSGA